MYEIETIYAESGELRARIVEDDQGVDDTYGYIVEERVVYKRVEETGVSTLDWLWRYEAVGSLWGLYGLDYAISMAKSDLGEHVRMSDSASLT